MASQSQNFAGGWSPEQRHDPDQIKLQNVIEKRRKSFLNTWKQEPAVMTYTELQSVGGTHKLQVWFHPEDGEMHLGDHSRLGRFNEANALLVRHNSNDAHFSPALWVKPKWDGYLRAYRRFLQIEYGCSMAKGKPTPASIGYDVDHLRNRARVPADSFIRVEASPSFANQAWGFLYEKAVSDKGNPGKPRGTADWMTLAKLAGVAPPTGPSDVAGIKRLLDFNRYYGFDSNEGLVKDMIEDAFKRAYLTEAKKTEPPLTTPEQ